ncbi:MAG: PAS domain S-box protein [Desulfobacterales bacterium]|nr:PAS domain S-box protein [Desulfobacterales bacterium]
MDTKTVPFKPRLIGDLLNIIHNAIIIINSENRIIFANSRTAEMFRTSVDKLIKTSFFKLFMPDDRKILVNNILHIVREEHELESEVMLRCLDGSTFMGLISGTSFQWDDTQTGMAFSVHDLTEMKAIERSLRNLERTAFLGHLVDDISHQIRNPVMIIGGFARRLKTEGLSSKKVKAILDEANRLEKLLDSLNNFTRLRSPVPVRLKMGELIDMAETTLRKRVEAFGCTWIGEYEENITDEDILIDKELMEEALKAIILNACESYNDIAAKEKNVIFQIRSSANPSLPYVINIIDRGVGISSDVAPQIFHHFYSNKTKHIGMGLTLAQRIIEEQRGTLAVSSVPGEGSTVSFHLMKERRRSIRTIKL